MRSFKLLSVWGIPIRINVSLLLFLPILAWLIADGRQIALYSGIIELFAPGRLSPDELQGTTTGWIIGIAAALGLFVSVALHELGHSWMALRYDIEIESITLWIFGGVANLKSIPREWNRELWIALAGPAVSVVLGVACALAVRVIPTSFQVVVFVLGWLAVTNVVLTGFNLIPAFPMDGGRVLRALLARTRPYGQATKLAARIGVTFAILFAVIGVFFNLLLILIALFIYAAATSESRVVELEESLSGLTVADVMEETPETLSTDTTVSEFVSRMLRTRRTTYAVVDDEGSIVGMVTLDDLKQHADRNDDTPVSEVMTETPHRVSPETDAFDALAELQDADYALVEADGEVVGLLTREDYGRALAVRQRALSSLQRTEPA